jgi:Zn finger protein HypA/HybF involved in hydrogenase expression
MAESYKLLSVALHARQIDTFAVCQNCHTVFQDDVPIVGSIACPNCQGFCLIRGVTAEEVQTYTKPKEG